MAKFENENLKTQYEGILEQQQRQFESSQNDVRHEHELSLSKPRGIDADKFQRLASENHNLSFRLSQVKGEFSSMKKSFGLQRRQLTEN